MNTLKSIANKFNPEKGNVAKVLKALKSEGPKVRVLTRQSTQTGDLIKQTWCIFFDSGREKLILGWEEYDADGEITQTKRTKFCVKPHESGRPNVKAGFNSHKYVS